MKCNVLFFLLLRRPPRPTRTDTLFPYTSLFRSQTKTSDDALSGDSDVTHPIAICPYDSWRCKWSAMAVAVAMTMAAAMTECVARLAGRSEEHTSELQ